MPQNGEFFLYAFISHFIAFSSNEFWKFSCCFHIDIFTLPLLQKSITFFLKTQSKWYQQHLIITFNQLAFSLFCFFFNFETIISAALIVTRVSWKRDFSLASHNFCHIDFSENTFLLCICVSCDSKTSSIDSYFQRVRSKMVLDFAVNCHFVEYYYYPMDCYHFRCYSRSTVAFDGHVLVLVAVNTHGVTMQTRPFDPLCDKPNSRE